ncbi:MAG: nucleotidyltransferase domain-containing protein [Candidatus Omnitrophota bacterium]
MINIEKRYLTVIKRILKDFAPECEVRVFGSRITKIIKKYSDLDLAIVAKKKLARGTMVRLKEAFEESTLPFRVEVLDWHVTSESFKKVIERRYEIIQKVKNNAS